MINGGDLDQMKEMFEEVLLKILAERATVQGPFHKKKITKYFGTMIQEARKEFNEDNKPTLDHFLKECFNDALDNN